MLIPRSTILFADQLRGLNFHLPGDPRAFDCRPHLGSGEFKPNLGGMKNFDQNCKVILAEYMCFYLLIKRCSKVKSSHLWAKGLEREAFKNSRLMILSFLLWQKKLTIKSSTWKGIKTQFWLGGGGRGGNWTSQPSKVQMLRGLPRGMLRLRIDQRINPSILWAATMLTWVSNPFYFFFGSVPHH